MKWIYTPENGKALMDEIYQELYAVAEPPLNFREAVKTGYAKTPRFFCRHYLAQAKQDAIADRVCKKRNVPKSETLRVYSSLAFGASPTSDRETMQRERKEAGL